MKWIIKGILDVILMLIQGLLNVLAKPFLNNFALDIGANLVTVNSSNERTTTSFSTAMGSILTGDSFFETVFPGIDDFCTVIMIFSIVLIIMIMIIELMKAMVLNPQEAEHPLSVVGRSLMAGMFVGLSYALFVAFEWIFNSIYFKFLNTKMDVDDSFNFFEFLTGGDSIKQLIADQTGASGVASLLCILILIMILIQFVKFVVDVTQRYVLLGVMFFTCPLPFATLASKNTSNIFKTWFKMVISQFILMIFAVFFINIFLKTMANAATITQSFNIMQYLAFMFMMYAWLLIGQKVDSYLNTMGLSAAQSAGNMLGAVTGGIAAIGAGVMIGKGAYGIAGTIDSFRKNPSTVLGQQKKQQKLNAAAQKLEAANYNKETGGNYYEDKAEKDASIAKEDLTTAREYTSAGGGKGFHALAKDMAETKYNGVAAGSAQSADVRKLAENLGVSANTASAAREMYKNELAAQRKQATSDKRNFNEAKAIQKLVNDSAEGKGKGQRQIHSAQQAFAKSFLAEQQSRAVPESSGPAPSAPAPSGSSPKTGGGGDTPRFSKPGGIFVQNKNMNKLNTRRVKSPSTRKPK